MVLREQGVILSNNSASASGALTALYGHLVIALGVESAGSCLKVTGAVQTVRSGA